MRPILPGVAIDRFAVNDQISEKWISLAIYIRSSWNKLEQVVNQIENPLVGHPAGVRNFADGRSEKGGLQFSYWTLY